LTAARALLFLHIPKTAGTSLRQLLEGAVPAAQRAWVYRDPPGMTPEAFMALPLEQRARMRLVYGHFHIGLDEHIPGPSTYVTMLRDPVERTISLYHHLLTVPDSPWHDRVVAGSLSLEDFACTGAAGMSDNRMLRLLLPGRMPAFGQWPDGALEAAIRSIEARFEAVLVMERMDASLAELGRILGRALGGVPRLNASRGRPAREHLDPRLVRRIEDANRLDLGLYHWALERLDGRITSDIGGAGGRLTLR
jgi:hypothetical protein